MAYAIGEIVQGVIKSIAPFGAFVSLQDDTVGLVHISEVSDKYVQDINEHIKVGDEVKVKILASEKGKLNLSIKQAIPKPQPKQVEPVDAFEEMLSKFKKSSEEKMSMIKQQKENRRGGRK